MIKRISVQGYKSLKDVEVKLRPLSVILGPNAAGKSNFLDAIYLVSRLGTCKNLKEAFEGHRGFPLESFYYGEEGYEQLNASEKITARFEVDIEFSQDVLRDVENIVQEKRKGLDDTRRERNISIQRFVRYGVSIEIVPETAILRVIDEFLQALKPNLTPKKRNPFIERRGNRLHLRLEGQAHPKYFEIGLDHTIVSTSLYEPHYPHIAALRKELENWRIYYFEPRDLMRATVPVAEIEAIGARGENLSSFLNTLQHRSPRDFESLKLSLKSILPAIDGVSIDRTSEGLLSLRVHENGLSFSSRLISEGTLRVLGLLAAVHPSAPTTVIGYEEPENGVDPKRLEVIAHLLKNACDEHGKQIVINTHSPQLPKYFDKNDLFLCKKDGVQTKILPFKSEGDLFISHEIEKALGERSF